MKSRVNELPRRYNCHERPPEWLSLAEERRHTISSQNHRSAIPVSRSAPKLIEWGIEVFLSLIGVVGWVEIVAVAPIEDIPPKDFTN